MEDFTEAELMELRMYFHACWSNAIYSEEYKKHEWQHLCKLLSKKGINVQI